MQTTIKGGTITTILTKTERRQLVVAADICDGIALIKFEPAATTATDLRALALSDNISRNGSVESEDKDKEGKGDVCTEPESK